MTQELAPPTRTTPGEIVPDPAFTIPPKRLAGSDDCCNCGTPLNGAFCHFCGQPDRKFLRFFPVLVREMLSDAMDFDSRFMRTMKPLLFLPGKLTKDYLAGRRFRYTPPMRLYIFSSAAFFILAALLAGSAIQVDGEENIERARSALEQSDLSEEEREEVRRALERIKPGLAAEVIGETPADSDAEATPDNSRGDQSGSAASQNGEDRAAGQDANGSSTGADASAAENTEETGRRRGNQTGITFETSDDGSGSEIFVFSNEPWDPETNPVDLAILPDFVNKWINDEIAESPQKGKEIEANPNLIVDKVFDVLPATMFVLLPLVALILKFWYAFSGRFYIEHLIMALHNHAFLYVLFFIFMIVDAVADWQDPTGDGLYADFALWLSIAMSIWVPLYMFIAMKRVYEQGWLLTIAKYVLVSVSYFALLGVATTMTALLSFVLL